MGKRKLAPEISPKKTIAGFFCGFASAIATAIIVLILWRSAPKILVFLIAINAGIVGQLGDLFESKVKRYFGVKDTGYIFPGHGGVWDRTDSLLWVYPVTLMILLVAPA